MTGFDGAPELDWQKLIQLLETPQTHLLEQLVGELRTLFPHGERITIALHDDPNDTFLVARAYWPADVSHLRFDLAQQALDQNRVIQWRNTDQATTDSTAVLCAPIIDSSQRLGVVYVDRTGAQTEFGETHALLLAKFVIIIAPYMSTIRARLPKPPKIFLSYAREDRPKAQSLADELRRRNVSVWFDSYIGISDNWHNRIFAALEECDAYIVLMTPHGVASQWVLRELQIAFKQDKKIIPLRYDDSPLPELIVRHKIQYRRMSDDVVATLTEIVGQLYVTLPDHNLRNPQELYGRDEDVEIIIENLVHTRLLTLIGAGGIGKTSLALKAGWTLLTRFRHGVWFVDFAGIEQTTPALLISTIARAVGHVETPEPNGLSGLVAYLKPRSVLLIFDNCEHIVEAIAPLVSVLLQQCLSLRILATSREKLDIANERIYRVPSLSVPNGLRLPSPAVLETYPVIQLFVERATKEKGLPFRVTQQNADALVQICQQLDGIPLAIELAAARCDVFSPEQLAVKLTNIFRLLTQGRRDALPRQKTLEATLDWSYALLAPLEKHLFMSVALFMGGWDSDAAQAICADTEMDEIDVAITLDALLNRSMISVVENDTAPRFRMLEPIRQYALSKLILSHDTATIEDLRARFCDYFVGLAEAEDAQANAVEPYAQVKREVANIRSALAWAMKDATAPHKLERALRLIFVLRLFWIERGYVGEVLADAEVAVTNSRWWVDTGSIGRATLARAIFAVGTLARAYGKHTDATRFIEESIEKLEAAGEAAILPRALNNLGNVAREKGEYGVAIGYYGVALTQLQKWGDTRRAAFVLNNIAQAERGTGDLVAAQTHLQEALDLMGQSADAEVGAYVWSSIGDIALEQQDDTLAAHALTQSLDLSRRTQDTKLLAYNFEYIAALAARREQWVRAVHLVAVADKVRAESGTGLTADIGELHLRELRLAPVKAALRLDEWTQAYADGQNMTLDAAFVLAQDSLSTP